jgi:hypothetical protein
MGRLRNDGRRRSQQLTRVCTNDGKESFVSLLNLRVFALLQCSLAALVAGCGGESGMGLVSGKVTVDGQVPAAGSSITFFPTDGKQSAGATLADGNYSVNVPTGESRVEIRVPRPVVSAPPAVPKQGPGSEGPAGGGYITESLPAKYNDKTELNVAGGTNQKDWEVSTKP